MPLSKIEFELLSKAADNADKAATASAENRVMLTEHSNQVKELFSRLNSVEGTSTEVRTRQMDCPARRDFEKLISPGNKSERTSVILASLAVIITLISLVWDRIGAIVK